MGLNCWVVYCGGDILAVPPTLGGVDAPGEAVITLTADSFKFELEQAPAGAADLASSFRLHSLLVLPCICTCFRRKSVGVRLRRCRPAKRCQRGSSRSGT